MLTLVMQKPMVLNISHFGATFLLCSTLLWCSGGGPGRLHLLGSLRLPPGWGCPTDVQQETGGRRTEVGVFLPHSFYFHATATVTTVLIHCDSSPPSALPVLTGFQLHHFPLWALSSGCGNGFLFSFPEGNTSPFLMHSCWMAAPIPL